MSEANDTSEVVTIPPAYLSASAKVFREKGFGAATTREITAAVGVQKSTLYHYVNGKDELLFELCRKAMNEVLAPARSIRDSGLPPLEILRALVENHLTATLNKIDEHQTQLIELRSLPTGFRSEIVRLRDEYEAIVCKVILACQEEGILAPSVEPRLLVLTLMGLINWPIFWFNPVGSLSIEDIADHLFQVFLNGTATA